VGLKGAGGFLAVSTSYSTDTSDLGSSSEHGFFLRLDTVTLTMTVREVAVAAYRESLPVLALSAVGGLFAGVVLGGMDAELEQVAGLLVLVPALLATRGNVYGSLGARLGSALHQGLVDPRFSTDDERVNAAATAALANGVLVSVVAAVLAVALLAALGRPSASLATIVPLTPVTAFLRRSSPADTSPESSLSK
jgi:mgtE-like transporter